MKKDVKKLLAGLGVASLISAGGVALPGAHAAGSGWGAKPSAGSAEVSKPAAASGWSGNKESAVSAGQEEAKKADEKIIEGEKKAKQPTEEIQKKKPAKSGWSGWWQRAVRTCIIDIQPEPLVGSGFAPISLPIL